MLPLVYSSGFASSSGSDMKILLIIIYWFMGIVMAIGLCCTVGLIINVLVALARSFSRPKNLGLALGYLLGAGFSLFVLWGCFHLAGWIGDRTNYSSPFSTFSWRRFSRYPGALRDSSVCWRRSQANSWNPRRVKANRVAGNIDLPAPDMREHVRRARRLARDAAE